ncbi:MAG: hypothetical protein ABWY64_05485 [Tardiphaga sp.]
MDTIDAVKRRGSQLSRNSGFVGSIGRQLARNAMSMHSVAIAGRGHLARGCLGILQSRILSRSKRKIGNNHDATKMM